MKSGLIATIDYCPPTLVHLQSVGSSSPSNSTERTPDMEPCLIQHYVI